MENCVPHVFTLGLLGFNINMLYMFFEQMYVKFSAYADDNSSYFCDSNLKVLFNKLQECALKLLE